MCYIFLAQLLVSSPQYGINKFIIEFYLFVIIMVVCKVSKHRKVFRTEEFIYFSFTVLLTRKERKKREADDDGTTVYSRYGTAYSK